MSRKEYTIKKTLFLPYIFLSRSTLALSMAPPMLMLPNTANAGFKDRLKTEETKAVNTAPPIPLCTVEPNNACHHHWLLYSRFQERAAHPQ